MFCGEKNKLTNEVEQVSQTDVIVEEVLIAMINIVSHNNKKKKIENAIPGQRPIKRTLRTAPRQKRGILGRTPPWPTRARAANAS